MARLNISDIKTEIRDDIASKFTGTKAFEQAIPDAQTVRRVNDLIVPYVAFHFGDLQRKYGGAEGIIGVRYDSFELPIYFQAVSGDPKIASDIADMVLDYMLGAEYQYSGEIRKKPGGGMYPIVSSNGATEAYMFPTSFAVSVQLLEK